MPKAKKASGRRAQGSRDPDPETSLEAVKEEMCAMREAAISNVDHIVITRE